MNHPESHNSLQSITDFIHRHKDIIITFFVGVISGVFAEMLVRGRGIGLTFTVILGVAGGWLGNILFKDIIHDLTGSSLADRLIRSIAGALILAVVVNLVLGKRNTKGYRDN